MRIKSSKDICKSTLECDDLSVLFSIIDLVISNEFYYKDEALKNTIKKRLKYLIQKDRHLPTVSCLHNILFTKNINRKSFGYEIYELYINCILPKNNIQSALPIDDFSFITFILFMDSNLYLETENFELKKYCNESIKKLIIYIAKIYDIYPENQRLTDLLNKYSYITCDSLFKSISECNYKILIHDDKKCTSSNNDHVHELTMKKIYKKIEEIFNYVDKKEEFIDKISFLSMKTKKLFKSIDNIEREYEKKYNGIRFYINFIYGTFINFPFDEPINKIEISLKRIVNNIALNMNNDYFSFIKFGYAEPVYIETFDSSIIINSIIGAICDFKSYSIDMGKMAKIENIVSNVCYESDRNSRDDLFALESAQFNSMDSALEAYKKSSGKIHRAQNRVYNAYKKYKINEDKIDSQATKAVRFLKKMVLGDKRQELIEGKKFTPIGLIKKLLGGYVAFSIAPVITILALAVRFGLDKKTTNRERKKLIMELETELQLLDEKINDARSASDNKAKYALMRTRSEVNNAIRKLKFGLEADEKSKSSVKRVLNK